MCAFLGSRWHFKFPLAVCVAFVFLVHVCVANVWFWAVYCLCGQFLFGCGMRRGIMYIFAFVFVVFCGCDDSVE